MIELTGYRDKHEYTNKHGVKSVVYLMDCMTAMAQMGDKEFGLAVVDPPYGLGKRTTDGGSKKNTQTKFMNDIRRTNWDDSVPSREYFDELLRVSNNYIVWGGNYFELHSYRTFIVWDKMTYVPTMSQVELAVTSFDSPARLIQINSNQLDRQHPTQKPVALYDWIFHNYAKPNDTIFDSHLGSGSSRIAAIQKELNTLHWYDRDIFTLYVKLGSSRKVQEDTGINYQAVCATVRKVKHELRDRLLHRDF